MIDNIYVKHVQLYYMSGIAKKSSTTNKAFKGDMFWGFFSYCPHPVISLKTSTYLCK